MEEMSEEERWYAYGNANGDGPWNDDKDEDEDDEVSIIPCQNCDAPLTPEQARHGTLFCSETCQQTAKALRYGWATLRDGRYQRDLDVRQAIDMRIAHILGGGYPEKARSLSDEQREAIFIRDNRRCCLCGAPATSIDHIAGSSPDPSNLQALCKPCNMAKARAHFRKATLEEAAEGNAIWARIRATQPVRLCDDEKQWNELQKELPQSSEREPEKQETPNF